MQVHSVQVEHNRQPVYRMDSVQLEHVAQPVYRIEFCTPSDQVFLKRRKILFCGTLPFLARPKDQSCRVCCDPCEFTFETRQPTAPFT